MQHIYTKFHTTAATAQNFQSILEMIFVHHEGRDVWVLRHENRESRIESQESRMWYAGYVGYVWGHASSNNNKANGGKHVKPIMPLPDTKTCFNANFRSPQKLNGHIFHI